MFPSVFKELALPAIKEKMLNHGFGEAETKAVMAALEIIRDGTRVQWRGEIIRQLNGCSLGPSDSCDYADIALDSFLKVLVPKLESSLSLDLSWLRFFRDDGFLVYFGDATLVLDILNVLNMERRELQFTTEFCKCGQVQGCCNSCPQSIPFLDCLVSVYPTTLEDGLNVFQLKTQTYAKPTDVHRYIPPSSCTPNLSSKSPSIIKGVAHRLRMTNMLDQHLISALNQYSGYVRVRPGSNSSAFQCYWGNLQ